MPNFLFCGMTRIRFLKLGYINNKHKGTVYLLFIEWVASVKEKFNEGYGTLINIIINLHLYLKLHYLTDARHTFY